MLVHVRIGWPVAPQPFAFPGRHIPRTAVLVPWFRDPSRRETGILVFRDGWDEQASLFGPESIAGTWRQIQALENASIPSLKHSLVILHSFQERRLTERERDWLWHGFGLPVFEQVIGPHGQLLATECEVHEGMHILAAGGSVTLENSGVNMEPCPCGRITPRTVVAKTPRALSRAASA